MFFRRLLRLLVTFYIQQQFLFVNFGFFTGLKFHLNININFAISLSRSFSVYALTGQHFLYVCSSPLLVFSAMLAADDASFVKVRKNEFTIQR